jgi:hypothetical protein
MPSAETSRSTSPSRTSKTRVQRILQSGATRTLAKIPPLAQRLRRRPEQNVHNEEQAADLPTENRIHGLRVSEETTREDGSRIQGYSRT